MINKRWLIAQIHWSSQCFVFWSPTRALPLDLLRGYRALQTPCWFLHVFHVRKGLWPFTNSQWYNKVLGKPLWIVIVCTTPHHGWWGRGLSHFWECSYRRDLGQIGILGANWHFRWGWFFLGGTWKLPA